MIQFCYQSLHKRTEARTGLFKNPLVQGCYAKYGILFNNQTRGLPYGSWPLRANGLILGLIILVSPNQVDRNGNNKVSKCKLKKYLFGEKKERITGEFRYSMTITISPLVAQPIKTQDLHQSTSWVILIQSYSLRLKKDA